MRWICVVSVMMTARLAVAHPMQHFDLAGLVKRSDAIVFAERIKIESPSTYSRIDHYRVTRVVTGKLAKGAEIAVEEFLYNTDRVKLDPQAVLFLVQRDGKLDLVMSGLRVVQGGKVFRFEQWNNPGGWEMVPQGDDPADIWNGTAAPIDLATFARALDAAQHRVAAYNAALALTDRDRRRAALLALFAPPGGVATGGFFHDELAQGAEHALVNAGDVEGALLVLERDRTAFRFELAPLKDVVAIARDPARPANVRAAAIAAIGDDTGHIGDTEAVHAVIALLDDRDPTVREAAVEVATPHGAMSSDPKEDARFHALEREERAALGKRWAVEADPGVLYALVAALEHPPARSSGPAIVARATIAARGLAVHIRCARAGVRVTGARVTPGAVSARAVDYQCGDTTTGLGGGAGTTPAGSYALALEATVDGKPTTIPLGTLVVGADGTLGVQR